jgi:hypothetical protein
MNSWVKEDIYIECIMFIGGSRNETKEMTDKFLEKTHK